MVIAGASYMHRSGLQILSGERQKQLQESIIAAETACTLVDEETAQTREKVMGGNGRIPRTRSVETAHTHTLPHGYYVCSSWILL